VRSGPTANWHFDSHRHCGFSLRFRQSSVEFLYTRRNRLNYNGFPHQNGDIATNRSIGSVEIVDKAPQTAAFAQAASFRHTARIYRIGSALGLA
jgi:hypothetical protein